MPRRGLCLRGAFCRSVQGEACEALDGAGRSAPGSGGFGRAFSPADQASRFGDKGRLRAAGEIDGGRVTGSAGAFLASWRGLWMRSGEF